MPVEIYSSASQPPYDGHELLVCVVEFELADQSRPDDHPALQDRPAFYDWKAGGLACPAIIGRNERPADRIPYLSEQALPALGTVNRAFYRILGANEAFSDAFRLSR
jgi:hypothetical protein